MRPYVLLSVGFAALATPALAEVRAASLFTDNMVLQRGVSAPIWGWANPGERVSVTGSWHAQANTTAGLDGKWMVRLKTLPAGGGPYTLTIRGENTLTFQNVLLGEVWLCSGQSNMEWSLGQVINFVPAGKGAGAPNLPLVRLFQVPNKRSSTPLETVDAKWNECNERTAMGFSAIAYFFARELIGELKTPVGLIQSDWGGTEVEVWIREGALREVPGFAERIDQVKKSANGGESTASWQKRLAEMEKGLGTFEKPDYDDASWQKIASIKSWEDSGLADFDGFGWYRATFEITQAYAGLPLTLELGEIDDEDVTFVNGEKVGETKVWNAKRTYTVDANKLTVGTNVLAVRVLDTGGGGGFTKPGEIRLQVGDHLVELNSWKWKKGISLAETNPPPPQRWPAADLYNGMIAPLVPYAIKGALWYQGESNVGRAYQYRTTFPTMIRNWRQDFNQGDFPFYFVQIAPFTGYGGGGASAELREAQLMTLGLKNTGMAVTTDITDNFADIHPMNKWDVGHRLALLALNRTYGKKRIDSGPIYKSFKVEGNRIRINFDSVGEQLEIRGGNLADLMIAGEDRKFVPAMAKLEGNSMVVWSEAVPHPVAVRYGWSDAPKPGLFNSAGLPASPFRTDKWPGVTEKVGW